MVKGAPRIDPQERVVAWRGNRFPATGRPRRRLFKGSRTPAHEVGGTSFSLSNPPRSASGRLRDRSASPWPGVVAGPGSVEIGPTPILVPSRQS